VLRTSTRQEIDGVGTAHCERRDVRLVLLEQNAPKTSAASPTAMKRHASVARRIAVTIRDTNAI